MLYAPVQPDEKSHVAVILMHSGADYFETPQALALAERGYLCFTAHIRNAAETLDDRFLDLLQIVKYAKEYPGVKKVVLFGHSGGATLMSGYQAIAEKGSSFFQQGRHVINLDEMEEFIPADGVMLIDANFGNGVMTLLSMDPAVISEENGVRLDPDLDWLNPANGFDENGNYHYSEDFIKHYVSEQGKRMNRLIDYAQSRVREIEKGTGLFLDDEPMLIPGGEQMAFCNKVFPQLIRYFSHTEKAWNLIHQDDSVTEEIVHCVRDPRKPLNATCNLRMGALQTTVRNFLKSSAVRATPDFHYDETTLYGVDWTSSYCVTVGNSTYITCPMLLMGLTGGYEYIAAEHIWRQAVNCRDKTVAFVEGASHNFTADKKEYGDTVNSCFNYVDRWLESRYL